MNAPQIALSALLGGALFYTVFGWARRYGALSGRSRLFRTVGLILLDLLLALALMWFFIDFTGGSGNERIAALRELFYILSCIVLVLFLLCIAALDALETLSAARREERAFIQETLREEIERARAREATAAADAAAPPADGSGRAA